MTIFSSRLTRNMSRQLLLCATLLCTSVHASDTAPQLAFPAEYRNWIFLTSGLDMTYDASGAMADHHMFDNVFVNPEAYASFKATGRWPDKTMLVKEVRGAQTKGSINKGGFFQDQDLMGLEVHMKDEKRFPGGWGFFAFSNEVSATAIPKESQCFACHGAHGAVDNTFVQFYPTLIKIAEEKKTLSASYLKEAKQP